MIRYFSYLTYYQYQQVVSPAGVIGRKLRSTPDSIRGAEGGLRRRSKLETTSYFVRSGEMALSCLLSVGEPLSIIILMLRALHSTLSTTHYPLLSLPILFYPHPLITN